MNKAGLRVALAGLLWAGAASAAVVDVLSHGAVANDTVNDTAAIHAALNAAATNGGGVEGDLVKRVRGVGALVVQREGRLVMDTGAAVGSAQAAVTLSRDQTGRGVLPGGARVFNFYDHPVKIRFDIESVSGRPAGGPSRNVFYFSIGDDGDGNYAPQAKVLDAGIGFCLEQLDTGEGPYWRLVYTALKDGVAAGETGVAAELSGVPSAMTVALDGRVASIQLEGASISKIGGTGRGSKGGRSLEARLTDLSSDVAGYTLAFGAYNLGTVVEKTVVTLQAVSVGVDAPLMVGQSGPERYAFPVIVSR